MDIGEQRRTIYVEPIEQPSADPMREPDHDEQPLPLEPVRLPVAQPSR